MLRRLKCLLVGHAPDPDAPKAWETPGKVRCARCQQLVPASGPIALRHLATLRRHGWTEDDLLATGHRYLPGDELLRFMRSIYDAQTEAPEKAAARAYAEGFAHGREFRATKELAA